MGGVGAGKLGIKRARRRATHLGPSALHELAFVRVRRLLVVQAPVLGRFTYAFRMLLVATLTRSHESTSPARDIHHLLGTNY